MSTSGKTRFVPENQILDGQHGQITLKSILLRSIVIKVTFFRNKSL
jgi:hypothetical protein